MHLLHTFYSHNFINAVSSVDPAALAATFGNHKIAETNMDVIKIISYLLIDILLISSAVLSSWIRFAMFTLWRNSASSFPWSTCKFPSVCSSKYTYPQGGAVEIFQREVEKDYRVQRLIKMNA